MLGKQNSSSQAAYFRMSQQSLSKPDPWVSITSYLKQFIRSGKEGDCIMYQHPHFPSLHTSLHAVLIILKWSFSHSCNRLHRKPLASSPAQPFFTLITDSKKSSCPGKLSILYVYMYSLFLIHHCKRDMYRAMATALHQLHQSKGV